MSQRRPIYLDLTRIHMPVTAIVSILHRVSGVLLFLTLPLLVAGLQALLGSQQSYAELTGWLQRPLLKLTVIALVFLFALHLAAGARHLLLDLGIGVRRSPAQAGARAVLIFAFSVTVITVIRLW